MLLIVTLHLVEAIEQHAYLILEVVQLVALLLLQALDVRDLYTVHICLRIQRHDAQRQQLLQRLHFAVRLHAKPSLGCRHVFLREHKFEHSVSKLYMAAHQGCLTEMNAWGVQRHIASCMYAMQWSMHRWLVAASLNSVSQPLSQEESLKDQQKPAAANYSILMHSNPFKYKKSAKRFQVRALMKPPTCAISVEVIHNHMVTLVKVLNGIWTLWVGRQCNFDKKTDSWENHLTVW